MELYRRRPMSERKIYSIAGLYNDPDKLTHAAREVASRYRNFDVHSPYPIHGMPRAMRLKPSPMGFFTLFFGLSGMFLALVFMGYVSVFDYPTIVGGKPHFALPAFTPVTFEVTVLLASIGTVVALLALVFKLPNNSHPLHDTAYMKAVSNDRYGISIEAKDKMFSENSVRELLQETGATEIQTIYYDEEEVNVFNKVFDLKFIILLIAIAIATSGVSYVVLNKLLYVHPFDWMMTQMRVDAQYPSKFWRGSFSMRRPPVGSVPRGAEVQFAKGPNDSAALRAMVNPIVADTAAISRGRSKFLTYCSPCHGNVAQGDSRLRGQFPNPPTLHSEKVRNWSDANIYYVITHGQNSMPSYAKQLTPEERWKVILYVRTLQKAFNATQGAAANGK